MSWQCPDGYSNADFVFIIGRIYFIFETKQDDNIYFINIRNKNKKNIFKS